jgi:spore coat polysaccharide biosynthesis protein SpsF
MSRIMKTCAIIQARQGSTRLPGKATIDICGKPALQRVIERLRAAKLLDDVIVATTTNAKDDAIISLCESLGCNYFRGSEEDVLSRVLEAARQFKVDVIVEITADCPLIDWTHVDHIVKLFLEGGYDHVSNVIERTFPRGYDIRVFSRDALELTNKEVDNPIDRQHVSTWHYLNPKGKQGYKCLNWSAPPGQNRPDIEVTLDTPEDLELIRWLFTFNGQGYNMALTCEQVIGILDTYPHMLEKVKKIQRKDYFQELEAAYEAQKGAKKQDEKVERPPETRVAKN